MRRFGLIGGLAQRSTSYADKPLAILPPPFFCYELDSTLRRALLADSTLAKDFGQSTLLERLTASDSTLGQRAQTDSTITRTMEADSTLEKDTELDSTIERARSNHDSRDPCDGS